MATITVDGKYEVEIPESGEVVIPEGVETVGDEFSDYVEELTKITFPKSLKLIKEQAFDGAQGLKEIVFPEGIALERIGYEAFNDCNLKNVSIPEGVKTIGYRAFERWDNEDYYIECLTLPKSIKEIDNDALGAAEEIVIYDNFDPDVQNAYEGVNFNTGKINSQIGRMCSTLDFEEGQTVTVKSSETDEIKYKVWMGADRADPFITNYLHSAWGHNATFAFRIIDHEFESLLENYDYHHKKIAEYRLKYPIELHEKFKEQYIDYLQEHSDNADEIINEMGECPNEDEIEPLDSYYKNLFGEELLLALRDESKNIKERITLFIDKIKKHDFPNSYDKGKIFSILMDCIFELSSLNHDIGHADDFDESMYISFSASGIYPFGEKYTPAQPKFRFETKTGLKNGMKPKEWVDNFCKQLDEFTEELVFERLLIDLLKIYNEMTKAAVDYDHYDMEKDQFELVLDVRVDAFTLGHYVSAEKYRNKEGKFESDSIMKPNTAEVDVFGQKADVLLYNLGYKVSNYDDTYDINLNDYVEEKDAFVFERESIEFEIPAKYFKDNSGKLVSKEIIFYKTKDEGYDVYFKNEK